MSFFRESFERLKEPLKSILSLLAPPVFPGDEEKTRRTATLNTLFLIAILALSFIMVGNWLGVKTPPVLNRVNFGVAAVTVTLYVLMRRGHVRFTSYVWLV